MGTTNTLDLNNRISALEKGGGGGTSDGASRADIATEFDATKNYTAGCFVYYEGKLYQFNADHAAGAWDPTDVVKANVTDQIVSNKASIDDLTDTVEESGLMSNPIDAVKNPDYVGENYLKVLRIGNLVNVSGRFEVATEKPAGQENYLFSNLPIPSAIASVYSDTNKSLIINSSGHLTANGAVATGFLNVNTTYASIL